MRHSLVRYVAPNTAASPLYASTLTIYSGGNDSVAIVHDLETSKPLDVFRHEEPVYGLSVHPSNSNIFLTACSDGRVLMFDLRQG